MTPAELTSNAGLLFVALGGVFAYVKWRRAEKDKAADLSVAGRKVNVLDDAGLRDDQREFIQLVREENSELRQTVADLNRRVNVMQLEIDRLRAELATERREREIAQARTGAETKTRSRLSSERAAVEGEVADEATITRAGDAAARVSRARPPDDEQ